jgi:hypothetical protein
MAWPNKMTLIEGFVTANNTIKQLGVHARAVDGNFGNDVTDRFIDNVKGRATSAQNALTRVQGAGFTGIQAFARDQFEDQTINIGAEFTSVLNAVNTVLAEIAALPNKDIGAMFTPAETQNLRTAISALATATGQ